MSTTHRLTALDSLRGIAALLVVTFHCWDLRFYVPSGAMAHFFSWSPLNLALSGRPSVILFFVLSGFVLACSLERSAGGFLVRRFCRVYLPFVAAIVLSVILYRLVRPHPMTGFPHWFTSVAWADALTPWLVAKHLLMLGIQGSDSLGLVMWSLVFELRISLIFPLLFLLAYRWPLKSLVLAFVVFVAAEPLSGCTALQCMPIRGDTLLQSFFMTGYFIVFFVAGIVLARYRASLRHRLQTMPGIGVAALGGASLYCMILPDVGLIGRFLPTDLTFGVGAAGFICLAIGSDAWGRVLSHRVLAHLGRISYSLYLTHMIVLTTLIHAFYGTVRDPVLLALILGLSLLLAEVNYRLIEAPASRLGLFLATRQASRRSADVLHAASWKIMPSVWRWPACNVLTPWRRVTR